MSVIKLIYGYTVDEILSVVRWEWVSDGAPVCEKLCVRVPAPADWDQFIDGLLAGRDTICLTVELYNENTMWSMPGSYITSMDYTHCDGDIFLDIQFLYPLDTKRFSPIVPNRPQPRTVRIRQRQPVNWNRVGF